MFEKVNKFHPDKVADRIAGALVDLAYAKQSNPIIAVEVLIGHGLCTIIAETSVDIYEQEVREIVTRIAGEHELRLVCVQQDRHLANNQIKVGAHAGDNGIFRGCPVTEEQRRLTETAHRLNDAFRSDGKYIARDGLLIACQSNAKEDDIKQVLRALPYEWHTTHINPLGDWTGGTDVDTGATNRKLGSDMGDAVTGGGLHGKDLSKADVSANILCHMIAQATGQQVLAHCAIGDDMVYLQVGEKRTSLEYEAVVKLARMYVDGLGGFEALAEWGLIR